MRKILIMDTSILCCWLQVPGKLTCGSGSDTWDFERVNQLIKNNNKSGAMFVLPVATIIETGNHIAQAPEYRFERAQRLSEIINSAADSESPWAAFSDQSILWTNCELKKLAIEWPALASQKISIGDTTIKSVAEHYAKMGIYDVEILTADEGLKSYEPVSKVHQPRRRAR